MNNRELRRQVEIHLNAKGQEFYKNTSWVHMAHRLGLSGDFHSSSKARKACKRFIELSGTTKLTKASPRKKKSNKFYASWEWKKVRFLILEKYGPVCMCCAYEGPNIVVDHIKPRSRYPALELDTDNLQVLCRECNMGKSNDNYTDFRPKDDELTDPEFAELALVHDIRDRL